MELRERNVNTKTKERGANAELERLDSNEAEESVIDSKKDSSKAYYDPSISIVVPCYEEALNVRPLCVRAFQAIAKAHINPSKVEMLLVDDDSGEGSKLTVKEVEELKREGYNIRVHTRKRSEGRGLSSAVVKGIDLAKHDVIVVMDADLQHEPESIPDIAEPVIRGEADFAVGSRNIGGGSVEDGWPFARRVISWGATTLARPLSPSSDPMSGFFSLRKGAYESIKHTLNPMGYKIGLELIARAKSPRVRDVPIRFRDREAGESKLTMKQNLLYVRHLFHLYSFKFPVLMLMVFLGVFAFLAVIIAVLIELFYFEPIYKLGGSTEGLLTLPPFKDMLPAKVKDFIRSIPIVGADR